MNNYKNKNKVEFSSKKILCTKKKNFEFEYLKVKEIWEKEIL